MSDPDLHFVGPAAQRAACGRMIDAGSAPEAIRTRILLIAQERSLPQTDVDRALGASAKRRIYLVDFANAHGINLNWLIFGDLRGLKRMRSEFPGASS